MLTHRNVHVLHDETPLQRNQDHKITYEVDAKEIFTTCILFICVGVVIGTVFAMMLGAILIW